MLQYMKPIVTKLSPKIAKNYCCPDCDYNTTKISDYKKHLLTIKHKNRDFEKEIEEVSALWETRKFKWTQNAKLAPTMKQYLQENFHDKT